MSEHSTRDSGAQTVLPEYEKPSIKVMNEDEVLSSFQVTLASITWWHM